MKLVVVESPTKAKTLGRFLGTEFKIEASMGHVRDLPKKNLGVDLEHDFRPEYVLVVGKKSVVAKLKKLAKSSTQVILATDPDREGEAIAFHLETLLRAKKKETKFSRIVFHEITRQAVETALKHPGQVDLALVDSQQARRVLDRLVGYKLSPLLWRKVRRGLSAGRVQSVAVRLVVEREKEIEAFKPEEYWEIKVELEAKTGRLLAKLEKIEGKKATVKNGQEAERIKSDLNKAQYRVSQVKSGPVKRYPAPPFITSTLQRSAGQKFGWSAKKIMSVAQKLYEMGLITYHRTDSVSLAAEAVAKARAYINKSYGAAFLPEKSIFYRSRSKLVQAAHEAIRPTHVETSELAESREFNRLYQLIWRRFVACQMKPAIFDRTTIEVEAKAEKVYGLKTVGERMKFAGWLKVYEKSSFVNGLVSLPEVKLGALLQLIKVLTEQKFTQPPARFTEASLIKVLEEKGIGRPSTYAPILSTIQQRQYVEKVEKQLRPTPVGVAVTEFLLKNFPKVMDYGFTATIEMDLDLIANGKKKWVGVIKQFYQPFAQRLERVGAKTKRVKIETEKTGEKCPECHEGEVIIRVGRFGKFLACSRFPECHYKANYKEVVPNVHCPECGAEVVVRKTKRGKRFYGCDNYPKCKWASWTKPK
jgi:DNA topoisomerase-1